MENNRLFSNEDWIATPKLVRAYIEKLEPMVQNLMEQVKLLTGWVETSENQVN